LRLGTAAVLLTALACISPAQASAIEINTPWGHAFIDDAPFHDPAQAGRLLPTTQVYPRGKIRDTVVDGKDVRMDVRVFTHGTGNPPVHYWVIEGDFRDLSFDRRIDIHPFQVSYVRYDFCRINPSNGRIEVCEPSDFIRIGRPAEPPPDGGGGGPPTSNDADGDGVSPPADCQDNNATVRPGATDVPGNAIDEDCSGSDAPGRLSAMVSNSFVVIRGRTRVKRLRVREAPPGAAVEVRCFGRRCPFRAKKTTVNAQGVANLRGFFRRRLRPGPTIEVRITAPNTIGKVVRYPIKRRDAPDSRTLCLPPGVEKPQRC
jgi:hypothetical protein